MLSMSLKVLAKFRSTSGRITGMKSFRHGTWMIAMKTKGFPITRSLRNLYPLTNLQNLECWRLDADNYETDEEWKKIRESRGYSYMDLIEVCPEKLPNYEEKIKNFFEEHLHTDEEIRYAIAGSGYFDVRDRNEAWIRVWMKKGGMIVLPAGIYHRFTLDTNNYIKAMRLFVGDPVWTPFNRPHDHLPERKKYLEAFVQKEDAGAAVDAAA